MSTTPDPDQGSHRLPGFDHALVRDAMRIGVMSCGPEVSASTVARMMATNHIHAVVVEGVVNDPVHGERFVWGVISDMNLIHALVHVGDDCSAWDLVATEPVAVEADAPLSAAVRLMEEHRIAHLIVTDAGRPMGVLSTLDVAGVLARGRA